jgi:hypothetical protein
LFLFVVELFLLSKMNMLISNLEQDKVTPAHDMNDKTLGEKHNLEIIDIFRCYNE